MLDRLIVTLAVGSFFLAGCKITGANVHSEDSYTPAAAVPIVENSVANSLKKVNLAVPAVIATRDAQLSVAFIIEKREQVSYDEIRTHMRSDMPLQCDRINENSCCSSTLFVRIKPIPELGANLDWLNTEILCDETNKEFNPGGTFNDSEFEGLARTIELKPRISEILVNATGANDELALAGLSDGSLLKLVFAENLAAFGNTLTCQNTVSPSCKKVTQSSLCSDPASAAGRVWLWNETKSKWCKSQVSCSC